MVSIIGDLTPAAYCVYFIMAFKSSRLFSIYTFFVIVVYFFIIFTFSLIYWDKIFKQKNPKDSPKIGWSPSLHIPLVTVICNASRIGFNNSSKNNLTYYFDISRQVLQFRVMLGTLLYFSFSPKWRIIVITDHQDTFDILLKAIERWPSVQLERLQLERKPIIMPEYKNSSQLSTHYRPCAWQKVFIEQSLPKEEAVVYIDTDVLFMGPAEDLWKVFSKLKKSQSIAISAEPWYIREDIRPLAGKVGLNSGVMAINLTKLSQIFPEPKTFGRRIVDEIALAKTRPRHEQDVINQFLYKEKDLFYELSFRWNFIPSDCSIFALSCSECSQNGINIVHGADATFFRDIDKIFKVNLRFNCVK